MSITKLRESSARYMKVFLYGFAFVFLASCFTYYGSTINRDGGARQGPSGTIASVNGLKITADDFDKIYNVQLGLAKEQGGVTAPREVSLKSNVLMRLIADCIRASAAQQRDITVTKREIRRERDRLVDQQIEQYREAAGGQGKKKLSDEEFDMQLRNNDMTLASLRRKIEETLTPDVVRQQLMIAKLEAQLRASVGNIDDKRLVDSFRQVKVREIVFQIGSKPEEQVKRRAEEVLKRIKAGEDFAKLAQEFSDDPSAKDKGGDLGFVRVSDDPDLQSLNVGQVSNVIKTFMGYHIVKVEDSKIELPKDFEKEKKKYRDELAMNLGNQAIFEFYQKMQKSAKVEVYDPELKGYWLADRARAPGISAAQRGKLLQQAIDSLSKATRDRSAGAAPYYKLAEIYYTQGKRDTAINILVDILDKRRIAEGLDLRIMLAQLYIENKQNDKAASQFELVSDMDSQAPDKPKLHMDLEKIFQKLGRPDLAAEEVKRLKELQPPTAAPGGSSKEKPATNPKERPESSPRSRTER